MKDLRTYRREYYRTYRKTHAATISAINQRYALKHPLVRLLASIRSRCNNPHNKSYLYYGQQGIRCLLTIEELNQLWQRDTASLQRPSIDRIDPYGNYSLKNCRFIELQENSAKQVRRIKRLGAGKREALNRASAGNSSQPVKRATTKIVGGLKRLSAGNGAKGRPATQMAGLIGAGNVTRTGTVGVGMRLHPHTLCL